MPQTNRVIPSSETLGILFPLTLRSPLFCLTLPVAWVLPSQRGLFPKARVWQQRVKVSMAANIRKQQPKRPKPGGQAPGTASHSLLTPCLLARPPLSVDVIPTSVWWSFLGWLQDGCSGGRHLSHLAQLHLEAQEKLFWEPSGERKLFLEAPPSQDFSFFWPHCGILVPLWWKYRILTTGSPGKFPKDIFLSYYWYLFVSLARIESWANL